MTSKHPLHKSFLMGKDGECLKILIEIHSEALKPLILDCTYNTGKMWSRIDYSPIKMDINGEFPVDLVGDFSKMPFKDKTFDIIVFDPPHLPTNAASKKSSKIWEKTYGITDSKNIGRDGDNVSGMFLPFLIEAKRTLKPGGIVLAKIADIVHNHKYQWQHVDFIQAAQSIEMTACDLMIKSDPSAGRLTSSKWKNQKHLRKSHCYWIVIRNSKRCERKR